MRVMREVYEREVNVWCRITKPVINYIHEENPNDYEDSIESLYLNVIRYIKV